MKEKKEKKEDRSETISFDKCAQQKREKKLSSMRESRDAKSSSLRQYART